MIEVYPKLFVGSDEDVPAARELGLKMLHCAKHPWHQWAVGYSGNLKPCHPDYLFKVSNHFDELSLNVVDAPFAPEDRLVDAAMVFLSSWLLTKWPVLVHCNIGMSRGPTFAFLWLATRRKWTYEQFLLAYPAFRPGAGMRQLIERRTGLSVPSVA